MQHDYYSQREAASYLGLSLFTLNYYRNSGDGPKTIKLGTGQTSRLVYRRTALDRWLKARAARTEDRKTAKARAQVRKAAEAAKAHESENAFRARIAEIVSGALDFDIVDLRKLMAAKGYETIKSVPAKERDIFLSALVETCMSGGADNE